MQGVRSSNLLTSTTKLLEKLRSLTFGDGPQKYSSRSVSKSVSKCAEDANVSPTN